MGHDKLDEAQDSWQEKGKELTDKTGNLAEETWDEAKRTIGDDEEASSNSK